LELRDGLDRKITYLRLSITDRCNLRCVYCMPEEGYQLCSHDNVLKLEDFRDITGRFVRLFGINKVRITGGEPLIKRNVEFLIRELASNPGIEDSGLTTNGILLKEKGKAIFDAGLHRVNISLDTLDAEKFRLISRIGELQSVLDGIMAAREIGFSPVKINTVLLPGFDEESEFIQWSGENGLIVRFIELMDGVSTISQLDNDNAPKMPEIIERIEKRYGRLDQINGVNDEHGNNAIRFRILSNNIIFEIIPSVTSHFCGSCNRLRLNCEGYLRYCLFSNQSLDLKPLINKSDNEFAGAIIEFVKNKTNRSHDRSIKSFMFSIGG
jgi:cyclic pyranopterin phosphate synthase